MKLISLNIWEGELYQPLVDFLNKYSSNTDIFCFQEVYKNEEGVRILNSEKIVTFDLLKEVFKNHNGYFEDYVAPGDYNKQGLAVFLKKDIEVKNHGELFVYNPPDMSISDSNPHTLWRNLQYLECNMDDKEFIVANFHGLFDIATKSHKDDTPDRIEQSRRIKVWLSKHSCPKILCGDFNLWPDTESMKILEEGMRNLIKEYSIKSTRSAFFNFPNKFADYMFVSPGIDVIDFRVLDENVSDHLALYLEFENA